MPLKSQIATTAETRDLMYRYLLKDISPLLYQLTCEKIASQFLRSYVTNSSY